MARHIERIRVGARTEDDEFVTARSGGNAMETLTEQVESKVRQMTHGRIRDLTVREIHGRILIRGQAPTHHAKQLALHGALQLLSNGRLHYEITVGKWGGGAGLPERVD
jgi:osmotically-inducible protein OsmY